MLLLKDNTNFFQQMTVKITEEPVILSTIWGGLRGVSWFIVLELPCIIIKFKRNGIFSVCHFSAQITKLQQDFHLRFDCYTIID